MNLYVTWKGVQPSLPCLGEDLPKSTYILISGVVGLDTVVYLRLQQTTVKPTGCWYGRYFSTDYKYGTGVRLESLL